MWLKKQKNELHPTGVVFVLFEFHFLQLSLQPK